MGLNNPGGIKGVVIPKADISGKLKTFRSNPVLGEILDLSGAVSDQTISNGDGKYIFQNIKAGGNYLVKPLTSICPKYIPEDRNYDPLGTTQINQDFIEDRFKHIKLHLYCFARNGYSYSINKPSISMHCGDYTGTQEACQTTRPFNLSAGLNTLIDKSSLYIDLGSNIYDFTDIIKNHLISFTNTNHLNIRSKTRWINYAGSGWLPWINIQLASVNHSDVDKRPYLEIVLTDDTIFKFFPTGDAYYYCDNISCVWSGGNEPNCAHALSCFDDEYLYSKIRRGWGYCQSYDFFMTFDISAALEY